MRCLTNILFIFVGVLLYRVSSACVKLSHAHGGLLAIRVRALESDCVFRANDRMTLKLYLAAATVDDLAGPTLYPKVDF